MAYVNPVKRLTTFLTQGIRLNSPEGGVYTSGDKVDGVIVHFDPTDRDAITSVDLVVFGRSDPEWDPDGDSSKSETGILEVKLNIFSNDEPVHGRKDFPFDLTFPSVTNRSPPYQHWAPHKRFADLYGHQLPTTFEGGYTRVRYFLTANVTTANRGVIEYTKQIKYRPSWNPDKEIPWMQHGCMLTGFMHSAKLLPAEDLEALLVSHPEAVHVQFDFPETLIEGDRLSGFIQAYLPSDIEYLNLRFVSVDLTFRRGVRVLHAGDETGNSPAYRPRRLAFGWPNATLRSRERVNIKTICRPADLTPPFYTLRTFNVYIVGTLHVRAIFTGSNGKVYRLAKSDLPVKVTGRPRGVQK